MLGSKWASLSQASLIHGYPSLIKIKEFLQDTYYLNKNIQSNWFKIWSSIQQSILKLNLNFQIKSPELHIHKSKLNKPVYVCGPHLSNLHLKICISFRWAPLVMELQGWPCRIIEAIPQRIHIRTWTGLWCEMELRGRVHINILTRAFTTSFLSFCSTYLSARNGWGDKDS